MKVTVNIVLDSSYVQGSLAKKNFRPTRSLNQSHGHKRQLPLIPCYYLIISKTELRSHLPELILPPTSAPQEMTHGS